MARLSNNAIYKKPRPPLGIIGGRDYETRHGRNYPAPMRRCLSSTAHQPINPIQFPLPHFAPAVTPGRNNLLNFSIMPPCMYDGFGMGVNYTDRTMIFRDTKESLYIDDCCHLNSRGDQLVARRICQIIIR